MNTIISHFKIYIYIYIYLVVYRVIIINDKGNRKQKMQNTFENSTYDNKININNK